MPVVADDFTAAWGLSSGHAQTFFASLARRPSRPALSRRRVETPDGDFVDVDVLTGQPGRPTVLVLHGLEGSSSSSYVSEVLRRLSALGWGGWALNFRGCSGEPNRTRAAYSSGDTRDLSLLVPMLPEGPRFAVGFSLGASVLLNGLARLDVPLDAAVAVSPPFELARSARAIDSRGGFGPVYLNHFLPSLKRKGLESARRFPDTFDAPTIRGLRTLRDFDHHVTARAFGYESAEAYYEGCSSGPVLARIRRPTLIVTAQDDAIAPAAALPKDAVENEALHVLRTSGGGHVGFVEGSPWRPRWWAERRAVEWLSARHVAG